MATLARRDIRGPLDFLDWLETPWAAALHPVSGHPLRMEDYVKNGSYVVRAEMPGINPDKDLEVTVSKGILTIKASRQEDSHARHHSEFRYGTFARSVTLPEGADEEHIEAVYDNGILEISVALASKSGEARRTIPVTVNHHIKAT
jgi:HSP20 family protein